MNGAVKQKVCEPMPVGRILDQLVEFLERRTKYLHHFGSLNFLVQNSILVDFTFHHFGVEEIISSQALGSM